MFPRNNTIALLLAVIAAPAALAQGTDPVQSIIEARRNGELLVPGDIALPERQVFPHRYPARPQVAGRTSAEVRAELEQARRAGDLLLPGERGITAYQANPSAYPARPVVAGKTREQVRAETLQAIRDGDILGPGQSGLTLRQLYPHRYLARDQSAPAQPIAADAPSRGRR